MLEVSSVLKSIIRTIVNVLKADLPLAEIIIQNSLSVNNNESSISYSCEHILNCNEIISELAVVYQLVYINLFAVYTINR